MKIHFAGSDGQVEFNVILEEAKAQNRLESFYGLGKRKPSTQFDLLLDSGGFVARTKGVQISVEQYANHINVNNIKVAFNLDTNDPIQTQQNQKYLEANTKAYIIPIYHLSDYLHLRNLLDQYIEKYAYIGIGGVAGEGSPVALQEVFYNHCFFKTRDKIKLHGLGITGKKMLEKYPWFSVDSTSWLAFARYGNSKTNSKKMSQVKAKTSPWQKNTLEEVKYWLALEAKLTKLWEMRGIKWNK
jgi:hypothetical protein